MQTNNPIEDEDQMPEVSTTTKDVVTHKPNGHAIPTNPAPQENLVGALRNKKVRDQSAGGRSNKVQTNIPVRTPDKQWFFRAHPDSGMSIPIDILEIKGGEDEGLWYIDPRISFPDELDTYIVPAILTRCITSDGIEFFYLAKQSAKSPKESTRRCLQEAKKSWIKQNWSPTAKGYQFQYANQMRREPTWSKFSLDDLLAKAVGDNLICTPDHAVITRLLNPDDDDIGGE
jgi:hypothetical protein